MVDNSANDPNNPSESVLNASVSDQAAELDSLGFEPYVMAIAEFLTNPVTQPPLTISIEGGWGSGKSSFMKQLQKVIEESEQKKFEKELQKNLGKFEQDIRNGIKSFLKKKHEKYVKIYNRVPKRLKLLARTTNLILESFIIVINIYKLSRLKINKLKPKPRTVWFNAWRHDKSEALWAAFALEFLQKISRSRSLSEIIPTLIGHTKLFFFRFNFQSGWLDFIRMIAQLAIVLSAIIIIIILSVFKGPSWVQQLSQTITNLNIRLEQTHKPPKQINTALAQNSNNQQNPKNSSPAQNISNQGASNNTNREIPIPIPLGIAGIGASVLATISLAQQLLKLVGDPKKSLTEYLKSPDYNNQIAFIERFHEDFKKIVDAYAGIGKKVYVFIDDLDRCELPKAADLMQALNLMISNDPHIIFILGIDRAKVAASLAVKYKDIIPYFPLSLIATDNETKNNRHLYLNGMEYGYSFLDKFIQISFQVPQPTDYELQHFLEEISFVQSEKESVLSQIISRFNQVFSNPPGTRFSPESEQLQNQPETTGNPIEITTQETNLQRRESFKIAVTKDSRRIKDIVMMLAPYFGNNPRRLKQFLNLFRLKTYIASNTGLFDELIDESQRISNQPLTLEQLGKFTAICLIWPRLLIDLDTNPQLIKRLQEFALQHITPEQDQEQNEYNDPIKEWCRVKKLVELLRYPAKEYYGSKYILEEKYTLEKVAIDKLLQVSPGKQDDLRSERGIDYTKLRDLLAARKWKEADQETYSVMCQLSGRERSKEITDEDMSNFPCTDLRTIDSLWLKYSTGHFGFNVQKEIFLEIGGRLDGNLDMEAWEKFGDRVGWRVGERWEMTTAFDLQSPRGHLPLPPFFHTFEGLVSSSILMRPDILERRIESAEMRWLNPALMITFFSRIQTCRV